MLSVDNISKSYGPQTLFRKASFSVSDYAKIGVVGPNGAGKSTFFRILMNDERADDGQIRFPANYRVAFMQQEWAPQPKDSILMAALREFRPWFEARTKLQKMEASLKKNSDAKAMSQYHDIENQFLALGGYGLEQSAKEILTGLGFQPEQLDTLCSQLSGGWRIRCHLAGLLLAQADLLLLDEPTNHLDVEAVVWLENFLQRYPKAFMLISHDRRLIERVAEQILEFAPPTLTLWTGSLKQYETQKVVRIEQLEAEIANKQKEIDRMLDFARRFGAKATKARQAQNRLKTADYYMSEVEKLKENMPVVSKRPSRFRLNIKKRLPRIVFEINHGVFGYKKSQPLFELERCVVEGGRKIGVIGVNGVGKTTFLKSVAGELPLLKGTLRKSEHTTVGLFAQHRMEELPAGYTALEYLYEKSFENTLPEVRSVAASLGLGGNDLDKPLDVLSGGEKARVSLARILLSRPGLLLLDEPTNHLDIEACDALVKGLANYDGTALIVSHNRAFLDSLVTHILEVRPGHAHLHHGNYTEHSNRARRQAAGVENETKNIIQTRGEGKKTKEQKRKEAEERKKRYEASKELKKQIKEVGRELEALTLERNELDPKLSEPESPKHPEFSKWIKRRSQLELEIEALESKWLHMSEEIDSIK